VLRTAVPAGSAGPFHGAAKVITLPLIAPGAHKPLAPPRATLRV
jgi:hypothetical protein